MTTLDFDDGGEQGPHDAAGAPSDAAATEAADGTAPDVSMEHVTITAAASPDAQELATAPTRSLRRKP
ncbi:hypothetical protein HK405_002249, partial [Cladochytrium tenue]